MKKLIFIAHGLEVGGLEKFLISLANYFATKIDVVIITISSGASLKSELHETVKFIDIKRKYKIDSKTIKQLNSILVREGDSHLCVMDFFCLFYYRIASYNLKTINHKVFISYHSTELRLKDEIVLRFCLLYLKKSDKIITVSYNQKEYIKTRYNLNVNQLSTVLNGIDTDFWNDHNCTYHNYQVRNDYNIGEITKIITLNAGMRIEKNHRGAVLAFKYLIENLYYGDVKLLFVGDGKERINLNELVNQLGLEDKIIFLGRISDVKKILCISDCVTLTSNGVETLSIAILEAMSFGIPCVLTNIGGADELIIEGINGELSDVDTKSIAIKWNKVLNNFYDKDQIRKLTVDKFSSKIMFKKYSDIFNLEL